MYKHSAVYYALAHSQIHYAITSYGSATATCLKPLEVLQNNILRIINFSDYRSSAQPLYKKFNILKLCDVYKVELAKLMHKCKFYQLPERLMQLYQKTDKKHSHNTRQANSSGYHIPIARTEFEKKAIHYRGCVLWNSIPNTVKDTESIQTLKYKYSKYLKQSY